MAEKELKKDTTAYRVKEVQLRVEILRRRWESILLTVLSCVCLMLTSWLSVIFVALPKASAITTGFGAMLLYEDAGGYVLVGVVAFAVGAVITGVCIWWHNRH
ncbi:MAG: glycosyltransferase [Angelakisella sp.]